MIDFETAKARIAESVQVQDHRPIPAGKPAAADSKLIAGSEAILQISEFSSTVFSYFSYSMICKHLSTSLVVPQMVSCRFRSPPSRAAAHELLNCRQETMNQTHTHD